MDPSANFIQANNFTKKWEKGYVNHPKDPGGATYNGLCLRLVKDLKMDLNGDGVIDARDIQWLRDNKRQDIVDQVFFDEFWRKPDVESLWDPRLQMAVYDCNVNAGCSRSVKCLQAALNKVFGSQLAVDGKRGPMTNKAIERVLEKGLGLTLAVQTVNERIAFHKTLAASKKHDYTPFLKGWLNRCNDLLYTIREMS